MRRLLFALSLMSLCFIAAPQPAHAYQFFKPSTCHQAPDSTVCSEGNKSGNPIAGPNGILLKITNIVAYAGGAAAIILIIIGAIRFVTSGSDTSVGSRIDDDVLNAKHTISSALIGLAIIVLAKTIITYVITKIG